MRATFCSGKILIIITFSPTGATVFVVMDHDSGNMMSTGLTLNQLIHGEARKLLPNDSPEIHFSGSTRRYESLSTVLQIEQTPL